MHNSQIKKKLQNEKGCGNVYDVIIVAYAYTRVRIYIAHIVI